jgi:hypothetical protein
VDATYHKVRVDGHVTSQATVVAVGVTSDADRQVLGVDVGPSEDRAFWAAFLRSLVKRGLRGVILVISDAHIGLKQAIATVLSGATWQRCRVHFLRNLLATVPQGAREPIAAIVRTIFAQPDHASAMAQLRKVPDGLRTRFVKTAALLEEAAEDVLAYRRFPSEHQRHAQHERARAPEERDQAALECRPDLSLAEIDAAACGRAVTRTSRGVVDRRAPLFQLRVDEATRGAGPGADRAGDVRGDRVRDRGGRLWKPFCGFRNAVDGALSVHGGGSATPW